MSWPILFKQCGDDHMTKGRSRPVDHLVIHYTATTASARNNAIYFSRNESQGSSAHYFIDDITEEIYQSVAEEDTAWHAGQWDMNCRSIGIEVVSAGEDYSAVELEKLRWLVGELMGRYGIDESHIIRHYDVTRKVCPAPYIDSGKWAELRAYIASAGTSNEPVAGTVETTSPEGGDSLPGSVDDLAQRVIRGEFGNGEARRAALGERYDEVQARVNEILLGTPTTPGVDVEALALAVIRGEYGNGEARKRALGENYAAVQARVNEILL